MERKKAPLVELTNVSKTYTMGESQVTALDEVSLQLFPSEVTTIVGSSGSGKSTLLHILGLLDRPTGGSVFVEGENITGFSDQKLASLRNNTFGFVFQHFNLLPRTSVFDNVLLPALYNRKLKTTEARERAEDILTQVGLSNRVNHLSNQLSGGQQQRVAIARALICDPRIILADEPTGNLDTKTGKEIADLLLSLGRQGKAIVFVTHDPKLARLGKHRIFLSDGRVVKEER